jgi:hypothetical protein
MAPIIPLVDFNGDEIVDANDETLLTEHLGQGDLRYDIGPFPWGDGKVDAADLEALQPYLGQEAYDPALIAYWKLDEAEGTVAADSAGGHDGTLVGSPLWQPAGGPKGGALLLDGLDDYIETPFVLDPSTGPFSVFTWVKGGAPGQVLVSQIDGAVWLAVDTTGALKTEIRGSSRASALISSAIITDGLWHRVGLTWDGSKRTLYVDDVAVVRDAQFPAGGLAPATGGLNLGAGSKLTPGTFWSGLIDDVRLYDRAVQP